MKPAAGTLLTAPTMPPLMIFSARRNSDRAGQPRRGRSGVRGPAPTAAAGASLERRDRDGRHVAAAAHAVPRRLAVDLQRAVLVEVLAAVQHGCPWPRRRVQRVERVLEAVLAGLERRRPMSRVVVAAAVGEVDDVAVVLFERWLPVPPICAGDPAAVVVDVEARRRRRRRPMRMPVGDRAAAGSMPSRASKISCGQ